jgi:hypothetical protein
MVSMVAVASLRGAVSLISVNRGIHLTGEVYGA